MTAKCQHSTVLYPMQAAEDWFAAKFGADGVPQEQIDEVFADPTIVFGQCANCLEYVVQRIPGGNN